ncbi:hypothetical protein BPOR_0258g00140 [Botrytis porri]|uniref:Uncharacterized protein n=1 Tax=Botrytis porri TaxID=87229 RepID=A0A4Z1KT75_9HELO|nr:hypothetical protein BPOR_0258g00140 [Botrytis porri]
MPEKGRFASATDEQLRDVKWLRAQFKEFQQAQERLDIAEKAILELHTQFKKQKPTYPRIPIPEKPPESLFYSRTQPSDNEKSETFATELHFEVKMPSAADRFQGSKEPGAKSRAS